MDDDPRLSLRPARVLGDLVGLALAMTLVWFHPGSGAVAFLDWTRLVLVALPVCAALLAAERLLLSHLRRIHEGSYPSILPVALVLFGLAVTLVGLANRLGPSAAHLHRPVVRELQALEWRGVTAVGDPVGQGRRSGDGVAFVESWRAVGEELQLPVEGEDLARAHRDPHPTIEVEEREGFLGVPYVASVRLVAR